MEKNSWRKCFHWETMLIDCVCFFSMVRMFGITRPLWRHRYYEPLLFVMIVTQNHNLNQVWRHLLIFTKIKVAKLMKDANRCWVELCVFYTVPGIIQNWSLAFKLNVFSIKNQNSQLRTCTNRVKFRTFAYFVRWCDTIHAALV